MGAPLFLSLWPSHPHRLPGGQRHRDQGGRGQPREPDAGGCRWEIRQTRDRRVFSSTRSLIAPRGDCIRGSPGLGRGCLSHGLELRRGRTGSIGRVHRSRETHRRGAAEMAAFGRRREPERPVARHRLDPLFRGHHESAATPQACPFRPRVAVIARIEHMVRLAVMLPVKSQRLRTMPFIIRPP